jgi:adenine-specific DNA-methyltransferase
MKNQTPHVATESPDQRQEIIDKLKDAAPEAFADGVLDVEKLKALVGDLTETGPERYTFTWSGKRDALLMLQAPTAATLIPSDKDSADFPNARNVFIEGENLEVLKVLYRSYFGRVKLIYIDPPYNTGNDFVYPDDFSDPLDHYLEITGQKGGNGGDYLTSLPERAGRLHSSWLSMLYPRLALARQLLSEDGVICISISDHEVANLRLLLDQVFGEESFVAQFVWKSRKFPDSRSTTQVSVDHEYILVYRRSPEAQFRGVERDETKFQNPDGDTRGPWMSRSMLGLATAEQRPNLHFPIVDPTTKIEYHPPADRGWRYNKARMQKLIAEGCILFPAKPEGRPREKKFKKDLQNEFMAIPSIIDDVHTSDGTEEIRKLFGFQAFDFPKPPELIRRFVEQLSGDDDIVLDFFAGSCSTAQAVMEQNRRDGRMRRYVCVQLPEPLSSASEAAKRGFSTIADIGRHRIRSYIEASKLKNKQGELDSLNSSSEGFRAFKLTSSNTRRWIGLAEKDADEYVAQLEVFRDTLVPGWKPENVIWEVALREGFSLTTRIEKMPAMKAQNTFWRVTDPEREQHFIVNLDDGIDAKAVAAFGLSKDDLFVCRDTALDDTQAANLALQCRLKVI